MEPVKTKQQFVALYERGIFGNHTETWSTAEEALASNAPGPFHIRNRVAGGITYYNIKRWDMFSTWKDALIRQPARLWYVSCMAPDYTIFQGEVMRGVGGLNLTFSLINAPMRTALAQQTLYAHGLRAKLLLEYYLDPGDLDWLMELLDEYDNPSHVIEFSHFAIPCGTLNRRMIVWENRCY